MVCFKRGLVFWFKYRYLPDKTSSDKIFEPETFEQLLQVRAGEANGLQILLKNIQSKIIIRFEKGIFEQK